VKAVILAGGLGTRLLPLTKKTPKPMLLLGKKPILEHLIDWNKKYL
jgi:mannose-1-phosphate guanylyltransferase